MFKRKCVECGRVFDLLDEVDAGEFYYGHDCEVVEEDDDNGYDPRFDDPDRWRWQSSQTGV